MYRKSARGWEKHLDFMIWDQLSLQIAFLLAYMLRNGLSNPYSHLIYCNVAFILVVIDAGVLLLFESLKNVLKRGYYQEFAMTVKHVILVVLVTTFYLFYIKRSEDYSRLALLYMTVLYLLVSYLTRILWKDQLRRKMRSSMKRSLLIITTKSMLDTVVYNIRNFNYEMFHVAGVAVIDCDMVGHDCGGVTVVANADTVADYVCREWVDEVFVNLPDDAPYPETLLNQLTEMGAVVHMKLAKTSNLIGEKKFVERLGIYTVLTTSINYATTKQLFMKRALDILGGLVGCLITVILTVILGPLIYIQSPGPIFFSQVRVGKNGKKFKIYKFRSMYMDAEERKTELMKENKMSSNLMFKMDFDPRIIGNKILPDGTKKTGIGQFIRSTSLDEFPQFFNVLIGQMSLIGFRPCLKSEYEEYDFHHRARIAMKPGITGMWQVSGRSDITDFEEVVKFDTEYIKNWSMGLDLRILFKTVAAVLKRDGSM